MAAPDSRKGLKALVLLIPVWLPAMVAALVAIALVTPVFADDAQTGGAGGDSSQAGRSDSTVTAPADTLQAGQAAEGHERTAGGANESFWEVHPDYDIKMSRRRDVTNWDSKIGLVKPLSDKISLNLTGTVSTRENSTLNRSDATDNSSAILRYKLNDNISFGMNYNNSVTAYRYNLSGTGPVDRRLAQDATITSELSKRLLDTIDLSVKASGGTTSNSFAAVSNQGRTKDIAASVSYVPGSSLRASATYTGKSMALDSKVDSSGTAVFHTNDQTFTQNLGVSLSYDGIPGVHVGFDAANNNDQRQHPDPVEKLQETESKSSKNASVTSSFDLFPSKWLTWDMAVRLSNSASKYVIRDRSNSTNTSADISGSAAIVPWGGGKLDLGGERENSRDVYVTADTGDNLHESLSLKLSQKLGSKTDAIFSATSDLTSVSFDDKVANPADRDRLNNRLTLDTNYRPYDNVTTALSCEYSEEQAVYTRPEQSANTRTTSRYRVAGTYSLKTAYDIAITQSYEIGSVYTIYRFETASSNLVRNSNITTSFQIPVTPAVGLTLDHSFKFQDQGSYHKQGHKQLYGRSAESQSNTLGLGMNYRIARHLNVSFKQDYYLQKNWKYKDGKKELDYATESTDISGRASFKYDLSDKTRLSLSIEDTNSEGNRVSAAFKKYWNIEFEASHVF